MDPHCKGISNSPQSAGQHLDLQLFSRHGWHWIGKALQFFFRSLAPCTNRTQFCTFLLMRSIQTLNATTSSVVCAVDREKGGAGSRRHVLYCIPSVREGDATPPASSCLSCERSMIIAGVQMRTSKGRKKTKTNKQKKKLYLESFIFFAVSFMFWSNYVLKLIIHEKKMLNLYTQLGKHYCRNKYDIPEQTPTMYKWKNTSTNIKIKTKNYKTNKKSSFQLKKKIRLVTVIQKTASRQTLPTYKSWIKKKHNWKVITNTICSDLQRVNSLQHVSNNNNLGWIQTVPLCIFFLFLSFVLLFFFFLPSPR